MKQFRLISLLLSTVFLAGMTACSDNDDPKATGTSARVTVTCVADKNNNSPLEVVLADSHKGDATMVDPGQTFTKEFEVAELPNNAGFFIYPSIIEENGKCSYTVKGEVALMNGTKVVKKETIDEKVTVTDIETDHTQAFFFNVTSEGLQRITDFTEPEIPVDENEESSGGIEHETEPENFITKLQTSYIVDFTVTHIIDKKDFRDWKKLSYNYDNYPGNIYNVKTHIRPIYDIQNDLNYYYIEQHISAGFAPSYCGIFNKTFTSDGCHTIGKVCEWYGESVQLTSAVKDLSITTYETMPQSSENKKSYSNSVTVGFSTEASGGIKGKDPEGSVKIAANYSSTKTISYEIADVSIENQTLTNYQLGWLFTINNWPEVGYAPLNTALTYINKGAAASRSTLTKKVIYYFRLDDTDIETFPILKLDLNLVLGSTGAKAEHERGSREMFVNERCEIELPYAHKLETPDAKGYNWKFEFPEDDEQHSKTKIKRVVKKATDKNPGYTIKKRTKQWSDK